MIIMVNENITELEKKLVPKGTVSVIGCGRLGIRVIMDLIEVHRGGPLQIFAYDGANIAKNDIIHRKYGAKIGENKAKFAEDFFSDKVVAVCENITIETVQSIKGDVAIICIAGGDTTPIREAIIKHCEKNNIKTIGTNGVFGIEETVKVGDAIYSDGPVNYVNIENEGHIVVGTGRYIRDGAPITPYILDEISKKMIIECLKIINKINK
ncbi:UBA/THIF-type NAD/FAD binding protein [Methanococcus aeolicus Nankai-3]|uniref:UBA/THIF-type NAD/FAD binding protein n=1 Tax=Methanococcus aeolicus (strain ATCC BAA-1280 / DSM 17508 / OCM 812 / Nankai-3) TaxID=419665 RepID=A6UUG0_META3|nr:UBA/THIF-type NAD/FAD binding protein [Methanococcus aeolicus Nankai-3]